MSEEKSLEELREQKRKENQQNQEGPDQEKAAENREQQIWTQAKSHMTSEATSRLGNIKAANSQKAMKIARQIPAISRQTGKKISDDDLKRLLKELENQNKSSGEIKYVQ